MTLFDAIKSVWQEWREAIRLIHYSSFYRRYVPYVPTLPETVKKMLEIAQVGPEDTVFDLGSGNGRMLITAVEEFRAKRAVGYEIREKLYKATLSKINDLGLKDRVNVVNGDLFEANLFEATVITLYLSSLANEKLKPKLEKEAKLGTRVISHGFEIPGWHETRKEALTMILFTFTSFLTLSKLGQRRTDP
jgi:hypothetical protein